ncbi:hypothetical protein [Clostridium sp. SM-530-WT-3G]|uniref:hypothetical protein n=1 Tax=Clostridium sp. SM-530-WT-3G TaxID=2725303 RepID=UPI00145F89A7|nr:hypothetical protein [Clostridium sp. SM-530-WT-3G]NME82440.1 hypothetical protein [Clostridium sp. SM-530-WT-3G]
MSILLSILYFVVLLAVMIGAYVLCRMYVFTKVRINKWIPLAIAIILFIIQLRLGAINRILSSGLSILIVLFLLWFMEILQTGGPKKKEKKIVIKPKAKPNRVKNRKKDN